MFIILCQATLIAAIQQWQHLSTPSPFLHIQLSREKRRLFSPWSIIFTRKYLSATDARQPDELLLSRWDAKLAAELPKFGHTHALTCHALSPQPSPQCCANQTFRRTLFVFAMLKLITEFPQELIIIPFPGQEVLLLCKAHGRARESRTVLCQ